MKKNYQFQQLLTLTKERCNSENELQLIAENELSRLYFLPSKNMFIYSWNRIINNDPNLICESSVQQHIDDSCSFNYHIHEYNGQPPYLEICIGNLTSILHFT